MYCFSDVLNCSVQMARQQPVVMPRQSCFRHHFFSLYFTVAIVLMVAPIISPYVRQLLVFVFENRKPTYMY